MAGKLKSELKQNKPFSSLEEEVVLSTIRTADHLLNQLGEALRGANLSLSQYNILRILRGAEEEGLACGEVSVRMVRRDPDLTRLLDRLEKRGLVARARWTSDRRVVRATITAEGRDLLRQLDAPIREVTRAALSHMPRPRLDLLSELLEEARSVCVTLAGKE